MGVKEKNKKRRGNGGQEKCFMFSVLVRDLYGMEMKGIKNGKTTVNEGKPC